MQFGNSLIPWNHYPWNSFILTPANPRIFREWKQLPSPPHRPASLIPRRLRRAMTSWRKLSWPTSRRGMQSSPKTHLTPWNPYLCKNSMRGSANSPYVRRMKTSSSIPPAYHFVDIAPLAARFDVLMASIMVFIDAGRMLRLYAWRKMCGSLWGMWSSLRRIIICSRESWICCLIPRGADGF